LPCKSGFTTSATGSDQPGACSVKVLLDGATAPTKGAIAAAAARGH
jgi:hypothetical protein